MSVNDMYQQFDRLVAEREQALRERDTAVEEARRGQEPLARLILEATTIRRAHRIARAALLDLPEPDA